MRSNSADNGPFTSLLASESIYRVEWSDDGEWPWVEMAVAQFQLLAGGTEENQAVLRPEIERSTF